MLLNGNKEKTEIKAGGPRVYVFGQEERDEVNEVLESGYLFRYGDPGDPRFKQKVYTLEKEYVAYSGMKHCLAMSLGTSALFLALLALEIGNTSSIYTSSKKIDFQNGIERGLPAILSAISGANAIQLYGGIYGEITHSPIQAILDEDLVGIIGRFLESVKVNDETIALDLIHSVGPMPGHFLDSEHTQKWWKKEQFMPDCSDLLTYPEWEMMGKNDCIYYATKKMEKILKEHDMSVKLTPEQENEIEETVKDLENFYKKSEDLF